MENCRHRLFADGELSLVMSKFRTICHFNACCIFAHNASPKLAELGAVTDFYGFDIICVTITELDSSVSNNLLLAPGFRSPFRLDRNLHGGGVLAYIKFVNVDWI